MGTIKTFEHKNENDMKKKVSIRLIKDMENLEVANDNNTIFFKNVYCRYILRFLKMYKLSHPINSSVE